LTDTTPLLRELREGGDTAAPIVAAHPEHPVTATFRAIAGAIQTRLDQGDARKPA